MSIGPSSLGIDIEDRDKWSWRSCSMVPATAVLVAIALWLIFV